VEATVADAHGYEPIWAEGEAPIAYVAAGGYGHTVEKSIALAYLPVAYAPVGTRLEVTIRGERRPATVVEQPLYDPEGARLLGRSLASEPA
jgi:dimethylglycine dehydrogenase